MKEWLKKEVKDRDKYLQMEEYRVIRERAKLRKHHRMCSYPVTSRSLSSDYRTQILEDKIKTLSKAMSFLVMGSSLLAH